jgi:hypothetical protein
VFKQQLLNLEQKLLLKVKESLNFNELDFNISEDEVLYAIEVLHFIFYIFVVNSTQFKITVFDVMIKRINR